MKVQTMMVLLLLAFAPALAGAQQEVEGAPAKTEMLEAVSETDDGTSQSRGSEWRLGFGLGAQHFQSDAADWFGELGQPTVALRLQRSLNELFPGLAAQLGASFSNRADTEGNGLQLSLFVTEARLGVAWQAPSWASWRGVQPYIGAGVLADYWRVRASDDLGDDRFVPGLDAAAGARINLDQLLGDEPGPLAVFAEGGYGWRLSQKIRLSPQSDDEDDPLLFGPSTRLGELSLSSWQWLVGIELML